MANEITVDVALSFLKGFSQQQMSPGAISVNMTGSAAVSAVQNIDFTTAEALAMGDVSSAGYAYFRNIGPTNAVDIGTGLAGSFAPFIRLKVGEAAVCRLGTNAPTARAVTAAINLQYMVIAD